VWRVSENRVLGRLFRPKREEVTGGWRKVHMRSDAYSYSSPNIIKVEGMGGVCSTNGSDEKCMQGFGEKT
jgi:hypothetical protein